MNESEKALRKMERCLNCKETRKINSILKGCPNHYFDYLYKKGWDDALKALKKGERKNAMRKV
jgi:hypothetical protein